MGPKVPLKLPEYESRGGALHAVAILVCGDACSVVAHSAVLARVSSAAKVITGLDGRS